MRKKTVAIMLCSALALQACSLGGSMDTSGDASAAEPVMLTADRDCPGRGCPSNDETELLGAAALAP